MKTGKKKQRTKPDPVKGQCRLCQDDPVNLQNSHILPRSFYQRFRGEKGHLQYIIGDGTGKEPPMQDGFKEHLLCRSCENKFSKWEGYTIKLFSNTPSFSRIPSLHNIALNIDYEKLKLFGMSLLWRMAITRLPDFSNVVLSPGESENLRKLLHSNTPSSPDHFGFYISALIFPDGRFYDDVMQMPRIEDVNSMQVPCVIIHGYQYTFPPREIPSKIAQNLLAKPEPNKILRIPVVSTAKFPTLNPIIERNRNGLRRRGR